MQTYYSYKDATDFGKQRIIFFSDSRIKEDGTTESGTFVQQYYVKKRMWFPSQRVPVNKLCDFAMCSLGYPFISMVGGEIGVVAVHLKYNIKENSIEFVGFTNFNMQQCSKLVAFQNKLYLLGGKVKQKRSRTVWYTASDNNWRLAEEMIVPRSSHAVLTSSKHIYVIGGTLDAGMHIECNSFHTGETTPWQELDPVPNAGSKIEASNFFTMDCQLACLFSRGDLIIFAKWNNAARSWKRTKLRNGDKDVIERVCQFSYESTDDPIYIIAQKRDKCNVENSYIPSLAFGNINDENDVESDESGKGQREVEFSDTLSVVYVSRNCTEE